MNTTARKTKIKGKVSLPPFVEISKTETKFEYRGTKFLLAEKSQGVYGMGTAMMLYKLDGVEKKFLRCIGWIYTDGGYHTHQKGEAFLGAGLFTTIQLRGGAIKYIDELLD